MATTFPTSKQTFTQHVDQSASDLMDAADINDVQDTVTALEDDLGYGSTRGTGFTHTRNSPVLGYAEVTADQGSITGVTDLTSLSTTVTVPAGGRRIKIEFAACWLSMAALQGVQGYIKEGSTILRMSGIGLNQGVPTVGTDILSLNFSVILTPTAGVHTYKLSAASMNNAITMKASSDRPAYILVELL